VPTEHDSTHCEVARAIALLHADQAAVCESIVPWAHGNVVRASQYPNYWSYNSVRVEEDLEMSTDDLVAFASEAIDGLAHVRIDFEDIDWAAPHEEELKARCWRATELVWMLHRGVRPKGGAVSPAVERVDYDEVHELRLIGYAEDMDDLEPDGFHEQARAVASERGAEVLAVRKGGRPIAFAQLERIGSSVEITQVFVHPDHRGGGYGTGITQAAIATANDSVSDLWIIADAADRPKHLYARLGFHTVARTVSFTRLPETAD
jgi:GNAT superfamily N-acetyltransferase